MFRSVQDRCFVDFTELNLPISTPEIICLLQQKGFGVARIDAVTEARAHVGKAAFRLGVRMSETPDTFDCSSFTKWSYGRKGVWIPRLAIQQFEYSSPVEMNMLQASDLIFTSGYCSRAWHIGHVSLYTGSSVITAMIHDRRNGSSGIIEMPLETLLQKRKLRGARRIITSAINTATLIVPKEYEIESSDDIKYLVLSWIT